MPANSHARKFEQPWNPLEPGETSTPGPFTIEFTPLPTETPLATLELPTPVNNPPVLQVWDGLPTYPAESRPGFFFRVRFDPDVWALTSDQFGFPAIGHRSIPGTRPDRRNSRATLLYMGSDRGLSFQFP